MKSKFFIVCFLLLSNLVLTQIPSYIPQDGLVGWWPFNGNANDESGNDNHGEVNNATLSTDRFNENNKAYDFQYSDYIEVYDNDLLDLTQSFTISAWYLTYNQSMYGAILGKGSTETNTGYALLHNVWDINNNVPSFNTGISLQNIPTYSSASECFIDPSVISTNIWYHMLSTYDGSVLKLYINNILVDTLHTNIVLAENPSTSLFFGKELENFRYFQGKIDDIGIWNRTFSDKEIEDLYVAEETSIETNVNGHIINNFDINLNIYPNPTTDVVNIDFNDISDYQGKWLKIMNMSGQIVYEENITQSKITLSVADRFSKGIYIVTTTDSDGNILSNEKLVVQ